MALAKNIAKTRMSEKVTLTPRYYVVCLIDLLGQKEKLSKWCDLPEGDEPTPAFIAALKETVGVVRGFEKAFTDYFNEAGQCTMPETHIQLSSEQQDIYRRFRDCEVKAQQFSDTFVFYAPTVNAHGNESVVPLHRILGACSMAMILSLAARLPVRGAITVGTGVELDGERFYGPALAEAYYLESKVAEYPRVIIAPSVLRHLDYLDNHPASGLLGKLLLASVRTDKPLLTDDVDGMTIVDFMGEGFRSQHDDAGQVREAVHKGYGFVCDELDRFQKDNNHKLAMRYGRLKHYMEPRLSLWKT